jgi:7-cyano-7-deazaguanine synthase
MGAHDKPVESATAAGALLSLKQVAERLNISESGVYRLIEGGDLRRLKVGGRTLFEPSEVERYITACRVATHRDLSPAADGAGRRAVVLLSGGLDSATVLAIAKHTGYSVYAISFRYGQRHAVELSAGRAVAKSLGVAEHVEVEIDLRLFGGSALTADLDVPKHDSADEIGSEGIPVTYVPARNTVFLSFALAWAEVLGADDLFLGVNALDYSGYPDCRPEYIAAFEQMANLATKRGVEGHRLRIHTPLIDLTKAETITRGLQLGVDYGLTRSCYDPTDAGESCGRCDSCLLRLRGFAENGVVDPAPYTSEIAAA